MIKKSLLLGMCILAVAFIFLNSSKNGAVSHNSSIYVANLVSSEIAKYFKGGKSLIESIDLGLLDKIVRKCAHTFEFMLLSIALTITFNALKMKKRNILMYTLIIVLCTASADETFQIFIPDRTASVIDVCIDFGGGIIGVMIAHLLIGIKNIIVKLFCKTQSI